MEASARAGDAPATVAAAATRRAASAAATFAADIRRSASAAFAVAAATRLSVSEAGPGAAAPLLCALGPSADLAATRTPQLPAEDAARARTAVRPG